MNQSFNDDDKVFIKMKIKLISPSKNDEKRYENKTSEGQLVLSIYDKGRKMLLSLDLSSHDDKIAKQEIVLANWSSTNNSKEKVVSPMNNQWHHIDITFHRHKSFTLTVDNRSHREKVIKR